MSLRFSEKAQGGDVDLRVIRIYLVLKCGSQMRSSKVNIKRSGAKTKLLAKKSKKHTRGTFLG